MKQYICAVDSNVKICNSMYQMELLADNYMEAVLPGQFFTVRISDSLIPLLRRPFAFSGFNCKERRITCIYQVRGNGTMLLSELSQSASIDVIAPLGKPFPIPERHQKPVLVAGGIGLGPILFLAESLKCLDYDFQLIFGCRSADYVPTNQFLHQEATICSDDGSIGFHGTLIDYLKVNKEALSSDTVFYCCGPHPMLHACHKFALDLDIVSYVSVEQVMACGVGACMGCAVKVHGEQSYVRACTEGPVFNSRDIQWE